MHGHTAAPGTPSTAGRVLHSTRFYDVAAFLLTFGREKRIRRETVARAGVARGDAVLDVGCGTGTLTLAAKDVAGPHGNVAGIDPSPEMIAASREKAQKAGAEIDFRVGVVEHLPFDDASFDAVLSSLMLHHLPDDVKRQGFAEIARVLRPGGRFVAVDMAGGSPGVLAHLPFLRHARPQHGATPHGHAHGDGLAATGAMLGAAGFTGITTGRMTVGPLSFVRATRA